MKSNKQMTMREFNYSHELKLAMNHANYVSNYLDNAFVQATNNDLILLGQALRTIETLKRDISVALRNMEWDS
jgi:hypothetical protein